MYLAKQHERNYRMNSLSHFNPLPHPDFNQFINLSTETLDYLSPLTFAPSALSYANLIQDLDSFVRHYTLELFKSLLEKLDFQFRHSPDRCRTYYVKQTRSRTITTLFGTLTYTRTEYVHRNTHKSFCYIDRKLGLDKRMRYDPTIQALAYSLYANHNSMIKVGQILGERIHGFSLRWNWTQLAIPRQTIQNMVKRFKDIPVTPIQRSKTPDTLFIMADEKYIPLQNQSESEPKKEMVKIATCFEGYIKKGKRIQILNKHRFYFEDSPFWEQVYDELNQIYDLEQVSDIYILGDGARWIKTGVDTFRSENTNVHFGLDKFHFFQALNHITDDKNIQNTIIDYALHSNKKGLKEIIDILIQQQPNREQVISDKANYILSNLSGIQTMFKEVKGGCCMEQEIQHTLQSCFTSVPKAFSKTNLSTYVKARIHHQNNVDLRTGYLKAWDSKEKPDYINSSYDFSMFDKREDTHSYYLNFYRKTY